jgi:HEPN domain-containing protein
MITRNQLRELARARLRDSEALIRARRFDGAAYLCGYAVELALKARICQTLRWIAGFPETNAEFQAYQSFRTHNLAVLLRLSGIEARIRINYIAEWSLVDRWDPEDRYKPVGNVTESSARSMIAAARVLLRVL